MKKQLLVILICALAFILLTACSQPEPPVQTQEIGDPVPMEYVLSNSDLTAEDFEGVDYEAFMNEMGLGTANIDEKLRLVPTLLEIHKKDLEREQLYGPYIDYSVIPQQAKGRLKEEDFDNIDVIICGDYDGDFNCALVIDFTTGKVYSGMGNFLEYCDDRYVTATLTDDDREWLISTFSESSITSWRRSYNGTNACTTGYAGRSFAFRLTDGRCVCYSSSGVRFSGAPADMGILCDKLFERFPMDYE